MVRTGTNVEWYDDAFCHLVYEHSMSVVDFELDIAGQAESDFHTDD